jgi:hypothetical protein
VNFFSFDGSWTLRACSRALDKARIQQFAGAVQFLGLEGLKESAARAAHPGNPRVELLRAKPPDA